MATGRRILFGLLLAGALAASAPLARPDEDELVAEVRRVYAVWRGTKDNEVERPEDGPLPGMWKSAPSVDDVNRKVFCERFLRVPFDVWDADRDAALLEDGLRLTAMHARTVGRPGRGVEAAKRFLARHPDHRDAPRIRALDRPASLLATGEVERAGVEADEHAGGLGGLLGARAWMLVGDLRALRGDFEAAQAAFVSGLALTREPEAIDGTKDEDWARLDVESENRRLRAGFTLRQRLVGRPLPKLERSIGAGNAIQALSATDRPLVLWFFSPSREDDLEMLLGLDTRMRADDAPASVVAVTWYENLDEPYPDPRWLYLPESREDLTARKVVVEKASKLGVPLKALRRNLGLEVPIAITKAPHAREWVGDDRVHTLLIATDAGRRVIVADGADDARAACALLDAALGRRGPAAR